MALWTMTGHSRARCFPQAESGVSAIEFALVLPFLLLLYLGSVELTHAIAVDRKVTAATGSVGDLVAQTDEVLPGDMNNIFNAAAAILAPYSITPLRIIVSGVEVTAEGPRVRWSASRNGTCREAGSSLHLPPDVSAPGQYVIVAEAEYAYHTTVGSIFIDSIQLSETFYLRPRGADTVTAPSPLPC